MIQAAIQPIQSADDETAVKLDVVVNAPRGEMPIRLHEASLTRTVSKMDAETHSVEPRLFSTDDEMEIMEVQRKN